MPVIERDFPVELKTNRERSPTKPFGIQSGKTWKIQKMSLLEKDAPVFNLELRVNEVMYGPILSTTFSQGKGGNPFLGVPIRADTTPYFVATPIDNLESPTTVTIHLTIQES